VRLLTYKETLKENVTTFLLAVMAIQKSDKGKESGIDEGANQSTIMAFNAKNELTLSKE